MVENIILQRKTKRRNINVNICDNLRRVGDMQ